MATVPAEIAKLPKLYRDLIRKQCGGDWSRVTVDSNGAITVHNHPQNQFAGPEGIDPVARRTPPRRDLRRPPATPSRASSIEDLPESLEHPAERLRRLAATSAPRRLAPPQNLGQVQPAKPTPRDVSGFRRVELPTVLPAKPRRRYVVMPSPPPPPQEQQVRPGNTWSPLTGSQDWTEGDLGGNAHELWLACRTGLPAEAPVYFHNDVSALDYIDLDMVESVVRQPDRVEIDPTTEVKKYPALKFWRGDVMVVVGFQEPRTPKIIAAYAAGLRLHDRHRRNQFGTGGARRALGLPSNPSGLMKRIRQLGAEVQEAADGKTATVTYRGKNLGKVPTVEGTPREDIENSYQRMQRKIHAIASRPTKAGL